MRRFLLPSIALCLLAPTVGAADEPAIALAAGLFDTAAWFDDKGDFDAVEAGIEWRGRPRTGLGIRPVVGASATDDAAVWAYVGGRRPFPLGRRWQVAIGFAAVAYERGDGKDLGSELQFRSAIDLSFGGAGGRRLGLEFYHLSNASTARVNPGSNSLRLVYAVPLGG